MTGFNHVLAGTIVAITFSNPLLVAALAFTSHFVLDSVPHFGRHQKLIPYNTAFKRYLLVDALLCFCALGFAILLSPNLWFILSWGAAWATLPDFLWLSRKRAPKRVHFFFHFHEKIQWGERPYGWIYEAVWTISFVCLLVVLSYSTL